jgi:hypothetical protein
MPTDPSTLQVYMLDVGQGDCTFIVPPKGEGHPILFDCADAYTAERFVSNHEITHLSAVVVSHLDHDHICGLLPFLRSFFENGGRVDRFLVGLDRIPHRGDGAALRALIEQALEWERQRRDEGFVLEHPGRTGPSLASGEGWKVDLVLPFWSTVVAELLEGGDEPNRCSAVLRIERQGTAILVGGDAPLVSWERLEPDLRPARVIRIPHHGGEIREGGAEWTRFEDLYGSVQASVACVSVGSRNSHGHPFPDHLVAARRGGDCRVLCTQLTPRCHDHPEALRAVALESAGMVEWPYRHRAQAGHPHGRPSQEVPCAGSLVAWLTREGQLGFEPRDGGLHDQFLQRVATPLCR